jgi:hypothetical protein
LILSLTAKVSVSPAVGALHRGALRKTLTLIATYLLGIIGINSDPEIIVYAFRGERTDYFFGIDPRLRFGHVGLSFDGGKTILGFNPHKPAGVSMETFVQRLRAGAAFPGAVQDDTRVFILARKHGLQIETVKYQMSGRDYRQVKNLIESDISNSPLQDKFYSFPRMGVGGFNAGCYNCATYPLSLGMETPYPSGKLGDYI